MGMWKMSFTDESQIISFKMPIVLRIPNIQIAGTYRLQADRWKIAAVDSHNPDWD